MSESSAGTTDASTEQPADGTTTSTTTAFMEVVSTVNVEGIVAVYTSGFLLTLTCYVLGMKIAIACGLVKKV